MIAADNIPGYQGPSPPNATVAGLLAVGLGAVVCFALITRGQKQSHLLFLLFGAVSIPFLNKLPGWGYAVLIAVGAPVGAILALSLRGHSGVQAPMYLVTAHRSARSSRLRLAVAAVRLTCICAVASTVVMMTLNGLYGMASDTGTEDAASPKEYPLGVKEDFLQGCELGGGEANYCECALDRTEERLTLDEYLQLEQTAMEAMLSGGEIPRGFTDIIEECVERTSWSSSIGWREILALYVALGILMLWRRLDRKQGTPP